MKSLLNLSSSLLAMTMFGGCAMLPYEEEFSCNRHIGLSTCTSVSENYYISKRLHSKSVYARYLEQFGDDMLLMGEDDTYPVVILTDGTELERQ